MMLTPTILLIDDAALNVQRNEGVSDRLVLVFRSIFTGVADVQFFHTATRMGQDHALFICDPRNTWLNGEGLLERIVAIIDKTVAAIKPAQIMALGSSMGGFMAMVMPKYTRIDKSLAFSPQFSVNPKIVPEENRWTDLAQSIGAFKLPSLRGQHQEGVEYIAVFPKKGVDADLHVPLIEKTMAPRKYLVPRATHNVAGYLQENAMLSRFIEFVFDGKYYRARTMIKEFDQALKAAKQATKEQKF